MYMIRIDHRIYERHPRTGEPFTLVSAMRELCGTGSVYGPAAVAVLRPDGEPAVIGAGSATAVTHAPTGRRIPRQRARHLRTTHACRIGAHGSCNGWVVGAFTAYRCACGTSCGCGPQRFPRTRTTTDTYTGERVRFWESIGVRCADTVVNVPYLPGGMWLDPTRVRPALLAELNPGIPADVLDSIANPPDLLPPLPRAGAR